MGKCNAGRRFWKLGKQETLRCYPRIKKEIQKAKNKKQGLSAKKIKKILNCATSFIGCFACDDLKTLSISSFPVYLIVNTDKRGSRGSHWISIRISKQTIELFDSLGLIKTNQLPMEILAFIQRFSISRTFIFNKRLQPDGSILCGFYCILYVILRQHCTFNLIESYFGKKLRNNDNIIKLFFSYFH